MVINAKEARDKANDYQKFLLGVHIIHGKTINRELNEIFKRVEGAASVGEYEIIYELNLDDDVKAALINVLRAFGYSVGIGGLSFIKISW